MENSDTGRHANWFHFQNINVLYKINLPSSTECVEICRPRVLFTFKFQTQQLSCCKHITILMSWSWMFNVALCSKTFVGLQGCSDSLGFTYLCLISNGCIKTSWAAGSVSHVLSSRMETLSYVIVRIRRTDPGSVGIRDRSNESYMANLLLFHLKWHLQWKKHIVILT